MYASPLCTNHDVSHASHAMMVVSPATQRDTHKNNNNVNSNIRIGSLTVSGKAPLIHSISISFVFNTIRFTKHSIYAIE